jgi:hypothetical protein
LSELVKQEAYVQKSFYEESCAMRWVQLQGGKGVAKVYDEGAQQGLFFVIISITTPLTLGRFLNVVAFWR